MAPDRGPLNVDRRATMPGTDVGSLSREFDENGVVKCCLDHKP